MKTTSNTFLITALIVVAGLFLLFGVGAMTETMMNSGWMGTGGTGGEGMLGRGWTYGLSWMWFPTLLTFVLGMLFSWILFNKRAVVLAPAKLAPRDGLGR